MVKKRNRRFRESDDSGSEFSESTSANEEPATKKYSLRQKRRTIFTEEFEYEFEEDGEANQRLPSDEDFVVEEEKAAEEPRKQELHIEPTPDAEYIDSNTFIKKIEPLIQYPADNSDGLIDFEDMIRADIVVNKKKIDYDKLIEGTEINVQKGSVDYESLINKNKIQQTADKKTTDKVPKKRGRKPKQQKLTEQETENGHSIFQHFLEPLMDCTFNDEDDDVPLAVILRNKDSAESNKSTNESTDVVSTQHVVTTNDVHENIEIECQTPISTEIPLQDQIVDNEKHKQAEISEETEKPSPTISMSNGVTKSHDDICDKTLKNLNCDLIIPKQEGSNEKSAESEENDDVILIEAPRDIIVLDD